MSIHYTRPRCVCATIVHVLKTAASERLPERYPEERAVPRVPSGIEVIRHPIRTCSSIDLIDCFLPAWDRYADSHR